MADSTRAMRRSIFESSLKWRLSKGLAAAVQPLLARNDVDEQAVRERAARADTAIFYSISNCQDGLRGVSFGELLQRAHLAKRDLGLVQLRIKGAAEGQDPIPHDAMQFREIRPARPRGRKTRVVRQIGAPHRPQPGPKDPRADMRTILRFARRGPGAVDDADISHVELNSMVVPRQL
jgi:hypothetical protein